MTAGAVLLHLAMFLGRGDYVAFDEAWYVILGRNLWTGHGYTMSGLRHVALSPLFPIVAGGVGQLVGSDVWGGRLVAAVASGLLVIPCWSIARWLAGRRTALRTAILVAVLPSLAAFVAPELVGWDLWVGAGPLFMLFLFAGIRLALAGLDSGSRWALPMAGGAFGLAFLDRPEAIAVLGFLGAGLVVLAARRRSARLLVGAALAAAAFGLTTAPYLLYLHDALGRWALTGRGVEVNAAAVGRTVRGGETSGAATVESMLWDGNAAAYAERLYRLDETGMHMADTYWGVPPRALARVRPRGLAQEASEARATPVPGVAAMAPVDAAGDATSAARAGQSALVPTRKRSTAQRLQLFARSLGFVLPVWLWPLALLGLLVPGSRRGRELLPFMPVAGAAVIVAGLVGIDPRTQLLLAGPLAVYVARGIRLAGVCTERRLGRARRRRGFVVGALAAVTLLALLGTDLRRLWLGATRPSVRQVIGAANRDVGAAVRAAVPSGERIMSWSPAIAVWADRDWMPLPTATLPRILRYARTNHANYIVFSTLNPSPMPKAEMPRAFVLLRLAPGVEDARRWTMRIDRVDGQYATGELLPAPADTAARAVPRDVPDGLAARRAFHTTPARR